MAVSDKDKQYLNADQQKQIADLQSAYAAAQAAGDTAAMENAHNQAESIRKSAGYSGGADGSGYTPLSNSNNGGNNAYNNAQAAQASSNYSTQQLSGSDANLSADLQAQIKALKDAYAAAQAAGNAAAMEEAHRKAEEIRNNAGYSGGADGSGSSLALGALGGMTADKVAQWAQDYKNANYDGKSGWDNGYSTAMNLRSMANYIRQQMDANSKAWQTADPETRAYLHQQNQELAKILAENNGGAQSTYNEALGRWETDNANLGYGFNTGQYNDRDFYKTVYGMTDDQINRYQNDTDRYYNFVDQRVARNLNDESSGYTGEYAQFVNGPYAQLLAGGTNGVNRDVYTNVIGDGFGDEANYTQKFDANGNVIPQAPELKNNNYIEDYTRNLAAYAQNGVIIPNALNSGGSGASGTPSGASAIPEARRNLYQSMEGSGPIYADSARELYDQQVQENLAKGNSGGSGSSSSLFSFGGSGGTDLSGYLNQMYDAQLKGQLAQLEAAYAENMAQLEQNQTKTDAAYDEQKRQAQGNAERSAANWRELATAQGLNTGAVGQAALAQNNQLQSNLNTLGAAQAQAMADIESQRALLGKQYQLQILQAQADNDMNRAQLLYQEAVRQDELLQAQQQQYMSMISDYLSSLGSGSSGSSKSSGGSGSGSGLGWLGEDDGSASSSSNGTSGGVSEDRVNAAARYASQLISLSGYGERDGDYLAKALLSNGYTPDEASEALNRLGIT